MLLVERTRGFPAADAVLAFITDLQVARGILTRAASFGATIGTVSDAVQEIGRALASRRGVRLALLFGSFAKQTSRPDSDVDLAVWAPGVDLLALAAELSLQLGREVDLVTLDDPGYPLLQSIVRDGIVVREASRGVAATWRARALSQLETDRPWWERMRDAQLHRAAGGCPASSRAPGLECA